MANTNGTRRKAITYKQKQTAKRVSGGFRCFWCGIERGPQWCNVFDPCGHEHHTDLSYDHVIPVFEGGQNDPWNIVVSCVPCNSGRGPKSTDEYHGIPSHEVVDYLFWRCLALGVVS